MIFISLFSSIVFAVLTVVCIGFGVMAIAFANPSIIMVVITIIGTYWVTLLLLELSIAFWIDFTHEQQTF